MNLYEFVPPRIKTFNIEWFMRGVRALRETDGKWIHPYWRSRFAGK